MFRIFFYLAHCQVGSQPDYHPQKLIMHIHGVLLFVTDFIKRFVENCGVVPEQQNGQAFQIMV